MKRIGLYLQAVPKNGGVYQYSLSILAALEALPKDQFAAVVLYSTDHWAPKLSASDCEVIPAPQKSFLLRALAYIWLELRLPIRFWRACIAPLSGFHRAFAEANCDYWIFPAQESDAFMTPVKAIAVIHDLMHRYEPRFPEVSAKGEFRRRETRYRAICQYARCVLVDSKTGKLQVDESYDIEQSRIRVLPFVAPTYVETGLSTEEFDQTYSLPKKYIFYPAQFWKHKNHQALMRAAESLSDRFPDIHLVFAGTEKNNYESCVQLAEQLHFRGSITFLGYVPDEHMPELYRRARAMVMPTFFGPTNIPPIEAFALGCPVAISDIYGTREQVGEAALLFDPTNVAEIENALARLWVDDELCRRLVRLGHEIIDRWGQKEFNERFHEILGSL